MNTVLTEIKNREKITFHIFLNIYQPSLGSGFLEGWTIKLGFTL